MNFQTSDSAIEFVEGLIDAVQEDVSNSLDEFTDEECTQFVRDFVEAIQAFRGEVKGDDENSLMAVARTMYYAEMFSHAFRRAYIYANKYVTASKSLQKVFENDSNDS